jgi:tripartite-type tricarboxylate transporter receptor subunit TctC
MDRPTSDAGRRRFVGALAAAPLAPFAARAQEKYPRKNVRIVVPFTPGGFNDQLARVLAQKLGEAWGVSVLVDNRPGGGTIIGTDLVAKSAPDGHTLLITGFAFAANASLHATLPYDPLADFAPVSLCAATPNLLVVNNDFPVKSVAELVALAKAKPGQLTFASAGPGSSTHLSMEWFKLRTGIDMVHVPYKGSAPSLVDVIGGRVPMTFDNTPNVIGHVRAGKLRAIAVTTPRRFAPLPNLPTVAETVPDFEVSSWFGLSAPARTPVAVIERIAQEVNRILGLADVRALFRDQGVETIGGSPEQFGNHLRSQIAKWGTIVKATGIRLQ